MVRHTPKVHARIRQMLDALRSRAASQVVMEMQLLRADDATLRSILAAHGGSVLDEAAEKQLKALEESGEMEVVSRGSVTCTNTQRVSLDDVARVVYVQDYDVEIAQGSSIPDPIMQHLPEGLRFDVRPVVAGDGDLVVMEVRADTSKLRRPMGSVVTQLGPIETPVIDVLKLRTTVAAPLGRPVIIGGSLSDGEGRGYLLVVKPTATRPR
jgi:type II secretory pathway component GspD/PulD (secretin)